MSPATPEGEVSLNQWPRQLPAQVVAVRAPPGDEALALRLIELGFIEGEPLRITACGQPGGDPLAVRLGGRGGAGAFALRRAEAALIWVRAAADPTWAGSTA